LLILKIVAIVVELIEFHRIKLNQGLNHHLIKLYK